MKDLQAKQKKGKSLYLFSIMVLIIAFNILSYEQVKREGKTVIKENCKIVKNSREPVCGQLKLELEKDLVIGNPEDERYAFFGGITVDIDEKGNIYILDMEARRVQKFDKDGKFILSVGRKGQGPGEFENSYFFLVDEKENIFILDYSNRKLNLFDNSGKFVQAIKLPFLVKSFSISTENHFLTHSEVFIKRGLTDAVQLLNKEGIVLKTIAEFPNIKFEVRLKKRPRFTVAFPELYLCPLKNNSAVFGYSAEYKLYKVDSKGNIIAIIEKDEPRRKVSRKEKNQVIKNLIRMYGRGDKRNEQDIRKRTFFSTYKPFFDKILADEDGCIFVRRYRIWSIKDKDIIYDFFNEKSKYLYELKVDKDPLVIRNGYLYTSEYDKTEECFKLIRYKIINWNKIKKGCTQDN